ncbi:uncharacterized protein LOC134526732 [Chroicocephalus ridibundus]|uniref:uncharacterized protein LOC134526732 n=1 Tax=Chroicocephalus ridibundus TaxID=1192867 RepID=UPI002FDDBDAB
MKLTIVTTVLLGLLLTPALAEYFPQKGGSQPVITRQFTIVGGFQILTLNREWRVATIEQRSNQGSWKTIWNYNLGYIASRVLSQGTCYISVMNRNVIPRFETLITLAEQNMGLRGQGQPAREITFVVKGPVLDLSSYGTDIMAMCRGLTTYLTYEVYGPQNTYNYGSCTVLDVLQLVDLKYCQANNKGPIQGYQPLEQIRQGLEELQKVLPGGDTYMHEGFERHNSTKGFPASPLRPEAISPLIASLKALISPNVVTTALALLRERPLGIHKPKPLPPFIFFKNQNGKRHHSEHSHRSFPDTGVSTDAKEGSKDWKSVWDVETGYVATKVLSKHTCIIAKIDKRFFLDKPFPAPPRGHQGLSPHQLPPRENRFTISRKRLQSLRPYGKCIQALCRGIPSYLAYPAAGSNFLKQDVACLKVKINELPFYFCD